MKKILLTTVLSLVLTLSMNAQLSEFSKIVKEEMPETYAPIKAMALDSWGSDHEMIVYTINKQTKAFSEIFEVIIKSANYDKDVLAKAMAKWNTSGKYGKESYDWSMVLYTYKKQIKNKDY